MLSKKSLSVIGATLLAFASLAQDADEFLKKFFAVQVEDVVFLRWTMKAGSTCEDTYVERSSDGISYEQIGLIGGICGSPDEEMTFEFTDTFPLVNRIAYYRLMLGYFGYSSPEVVEFVRFNDQGFFLGPNPFRDYSRIVFENKDKAEHSVMIFDMFGQKVMEMITTNNEFLIRREDFEGGTYVLLLKKGSDIIFREKIIAN